MLKKIKLLPLLCVTAMLTLLGLQGYWINKYYNITKQSFEKEVNLAFEDAFKKEFSNRADRIQSILKKRLLDTTHFQITSKLNKDNEVVYTVGETKNPNDKFSKSFSTSQLNVMITAENKKVITDKIAERFSELLRNEDLDNHIIYYRTQDLGKYMLNLTNEITFDTINLRPVLDKYLAERSIFVDYQFYAKQKDSTTNKSTFKPDLLSKFPTITRSLPTYTHKPGQNYIRVMFKDPHTYILSNMWIILSSSIFLVLLIAFCLGYLLRVLKREKKLSSIKNDFISNITHEFKTPIATAMLAVDSLSDKMVRKDEEKTERYLKHAKNELTRINTLTDKILKLSVYDKSNYKLKKEPVQVDKVIQGIIEIHQLQKKDCTLIFENSTAINEIVVDKEQFQHAISNALENSIKYGNDSIVIEISCSVKESHFITSIKDNGSGIDKAEIPLIFEKFYRAKHSSATNIKGYGLGLNYVKQIMQQHNGWYKMKSDLNGTELKLAWPI